MTRATMDEPVVYRTPIFDNRRWRNFEARPGDIFVCTPAKCGTTWTQTIVASLLFPDGDFPMPVMMMSPWIEFEMFPEEEMLASLAAQLHRRFMKSHTAADGIPWFDDASYIVVGRDGRDAFMSLCNHVERLKGMDEINARAAASGISPMPDYDGDIHAFFASWLDDEDHFFHIVSTYWERRKQSNVLLVHYGDLKRDLPAEMRRIADFLGADLTEPQWAAAAERCSFDYMRNHPEMVGEFDMFFEGGAKGFIYKGTNGRWRDVLTEAELAAYDMRARELLPPEALRWVEQGRGESGGTRRR